MEVKDFGAECDGVWRFSCWMAFVNLHPFYRLSLWLVLRRQRLHGSDEGSVAYDHRHTRQLSFDHERLTVTA